MQYLSIALIGAVAIFFWWLSTKRVKKIQKYNKIGVAAGASTPESAIEEVILNMSDKITDNNEMSMQEFMDYIQTW